MFSGRSGTGLQTQTINMGENRQNLQLQEVYNDSKKEKKTEQNNKDETFAHQSFTKINLTFIKTSSLVKQGWY